MAKKTEIVLDGLVTSAKLYVFREYLVLHI
jgi:hypothetical protein